MQASLQSASCSSVRSRDAPLLRPGQLQLRRRARQRSKSLPSGCDPKGGGRAGALPRALPWTAATTASEQRFIGYRSERPWTL
jgi:hypothetical protein